MKVTKEFHIELAGIPHNSACFSDHLPTLSANVICERPRKPVGLPLVIIYDTGLVLPRAVPPRPLAMDEPLLSALVTEQSPTPLSFSRAIS